MHIFLAIHHFPPKYTGGAEWRAFRTARALIERGHRVTVAAVEDVRSTACGVQRTEYEGVPVFRLYFNLQAAPDPFRWSWDNPWLGDFFREQFTAQKPDVFHVFSGYLMGARPLRVAQEMGIPTVISLTDFWFLCPRITMLRSDGGISTLPIDPVRCARCLGEEKRRFRYLGKVAPALAQGYWRLQKRNAAALRERLDFLISTLNRVDCAISPSHFVRQMHIQAGVDAGRVIFSRQGRDFPALGEAARQKSPSAVLRVGYIGQIAPHKGVHTLLEAVRALPDAPLEVHLYGDATPFPAYTRRLKALSANDRRIHWEGVFERQAIGAVHKGLDVLVVPSTWYENSPNTILEAFAYGTPVLASDLGGMAELVREGENGLRFPPGDSAALAGLLARLVEDRALLAGLRPSRVGIPSVAQEMDALEAIYARYT
ncbi:MAG: glycosyltransferase family 4 protein [Anaerolineales bacterium]